MATLYTVGAAGISYWLFSECDNVSNSLHIGLTALSHIKKRCYGLMKPIPKGMFGAKTKKHITKRA